jgi:hypothetical protein
MAHLPRNLAGFGRGRGGTRYAWCQHDERIPGTFVRRVGQPPTRAPP